MSLECEICGKLVCFGHEEEPTEVQETEAVEEPQPEVKIVEKE